MSCTGNRNGCWPERRRASMIWRRRLSRATETILLKRRSRWELLHSSLNGLSPKAILARGYALVFDAAGNLVKDASQLKRGDAVRAQLGRGEFTAKVNQTKLDADTE